MRQKYFFIFLLLTFILTSNCIKSESEPNNTPEQGSLLDCNGASSGSLDINTDNVDWWKVTVPSDGHLIIATLSDASLEIDNYIYDQDKVSQIASYAYGGSHTWDTTYFVNLVPGTYYIKSSCWSGTGNYTITNKFIPANLQNDANVNDSAQVAVSLELNGSSTGHLGYYSLGYTDPEDWWKVTVPLDGKLIIATNSDPTLEIDNYIYDKDKKSQIASYAYGGSHTWDTTYFVNLVPGTYYIRSYRWSGYGSYTITNNFIPATLVNDAELNDTVEASITLALNSSATGHLGFYSLGYIDPADWREIVIPADGRLVIATESDPTLEIDNYIYDQDMKTQIASYAYSGSHTWDTTYFNYLTPGTYYVKSSRYTGYGSYTIENKFIPARYSNDVEVNDSIPVAKSILISTECTGHLGYYNRGITDDNDYFSFSISSVWDTLFIRTDTEPTLEADLNLFNSTGDNINHAGAYGTLEMIVNPNLQPGNYFVQVKRWSGYGSYGLLVTNVRPSIPLVEVKEAAKTIIPDKFELHQNYPNPFNPATTISFSIPEEGYVQLRIYNSLGQLIKTLIDEQKDAGYYNIKWQPENASSGMYLYQLRFNDKVQTHKMIYMK